MRSVEWVCDQEDDGDDDTTLTAGVQLNGRLHDMNRRSRNVPSDEDDPCLAQSQRDIDVVYSE